MMISAMMVTLRQLFVQRALFKKSLLSIFCLILTFKVVEYTFLNILIPCISNAVKEGEYSLWNVALLANLVGASRTVSTIGLVAAADFYTGRFPMLLFATVVLIIGLALNVFMKEVGGPLFYGALALLTAGQAVLPTMLKAFLNDQLRPWDANEKQRRRHTKLLWRFLSVAAAMISLVVPAMWMYELNTLANTFTLVTALSSMVFLSCYRHYNIVAPPESAEQVQRAKFSCSMITLWLCFIPLKDNRFDEYYKTLVYWSAGNFVLYCFISYFCKENTFPHGDEEASNTTGLSEEELISL